MALSLTEEGLKMNESTDGTSRGEFLARGAGLAGLAAGAGVLASGLVGRTDTARAGELFPAFSTAAVADAWFYDDLIGRSTDAIMGMHVATSGTGAGWTAANTQGRFGVWTGGTGTTSSGLAELQTQVGAAPYPISLRVPGIYLRLGAFVRIPTLSTSGQRFWVGVGFGRATGTRKCLFRYKDDVNGGKWQAYVTDDAGTAWTAQDTGITVTAGTWYQLEIDVYEIGGGDYGAEFYVDGIPVCAFDEPGAGSDTIPNNGWMGVGIEKTVGTTERTVDVDAYWFNASTSRYVVGA
jgi:hypothetical protein